MNLADALHEWDVEAVRDHPEQVEESRRHYAELRESNSFLDRSVSWFLDLKRVDQSALLENIGHGELDEGDGQVVEIVRYLETLEASTSQNGHKPSGGMRLVDAYYRSRAIFDGAYAELEGHPDDPTDAELTRFYSETPCPYPEDDGYPLMAGWETLWPFLLKPYSWYRELPAERRLEYMLKVEGEPVLAEAIAGNFDFIEDTDATTSSSGRDGPVRVHRDPGKALLAYLAGKEAPVPARFVADVLLLHCNAKTGHTWPSVSTIEGYTGFGRRTVQRAISWLIDEKVIREVKPFQHGGDRYASRVFEFTSKVPL